MEIENVQSPDDR